MIEHTRKGMILGLLTTAIIGFSVSTAAQSPDIDSVKPWPKDVGHGDQVYVDSEVSNPENIESAWYVVRSNGERVGSGSLADSNNDGYYVSPVAVTVDGGERYNIEVNFCDDDNQCSSKTTQIRSSCSVELFESCLR